MTHRRERENISKTRKKKKKTKIEMQEENTTPPSLYDRIPLKNKSIEALDLLKNRVFVYTVPRHLVPRALGFEKNNLKK